MSQRAVERALGKLVTDEMFRDEFFGDPERVTLRAGLICPEGNWRGCHGFHEPHSLNLVRASMTGSAGFMLRHDQIQGETPQ